MKLLKQEFERRKKLNPQYSLRAFSRDAGVSQTLISMYFAGRRGLSLKSSLSIATKLALKADDQKELLREISVSTGEILQYGKSTAEPEIKTQGPQGYRDARFRYDHTPIELTPVEILIMDLTLLKGFQADVKWISKKLGLPLSTTIECLERLQKNGFLNVSKNGKIKKTNAHLHRFHASNLGSVRKVHREMLKRALTELDHVDEESVAKRWFGSFTISGDLSKINEVKKRIASFQEEIAVLIASTEEPTELVQLNVQLFRVVR